MKAIELIGNTPVVQIPDTNIYVKLEKYNLGGSVKDRAVLYMLEDALKKGLIKEDTVLIEASSGNTGIALAMLGALYQIPVTIVMPDSMSVERRQADACLRCRGIAERRSERNERGRGLYGGIKKAGSALSFTGAI